MESGVYRVNRKKNHTGDIEKYAFDKEMVKGRLKELCDKNENQDEVGEKIWAKGESTRQQGAQSDTG